MVSLSIFTSCAVFCKQSYAISYIAWLSCKLWCYRRISSPKKSRNNTPEKIRIFFTCVWYRQSAAETSFLFHTTSSGWWTNGKAFTIPNPRSFVEFFRFMAADVQTLQGREENQNTKKKKTETYIFSVVDNEISCGWKRKSSAKRFAIGRFWPWTWKISSVGKNQFNYWQFSILKIRPIICLCSNSTYVFILRAQTIVNGRLGEHSIGWKPLRFASWFPTLILCSPNLPRVYIRLCKHGNHFTFLHYCTAEVFFR